MRERRKSGRRKQDDYDDEPTPEDRGWVLKKRSEVRSDEEIVERVPRRQQMVPYRPKMDRRASSLDGNDYRDRREGRNDRRVGAYRGRNDASDSEGSVPPQSRVSRARSRRSSTSDSSSEDLGSSTDDQRRCRDVSRKKWLTGSLAAVATVHAAAKIYSSLEKRDSRHAKVLAGELSPEEARKLRNKGRVQDAAAVGVAALGIRGAMGEWHEVEEKAEEHKRYLKQREENHRKRMERQKRWRERQMNGRGSDDDFGDRDGRSRGQRAIKSHGESGKYRSKSMSTYDDDHDSRALVRSKSRRRNDD